MSEKPSAFKYLSRFFMNLNQIITIFGVLGSVSDKNGPHFFVFYFVSVSFTLWLLGLIKMLLIHSDRKNKPTRVYKCRRDLVLGYGGITVCGFVPQVAVLFVDKKAIMITICFACNTIPIIFYYMFIKKHFKNYEVLKKRLPIRVIAFVLNYFFVVLFMVISSEFHSKDKFSEVQLFLGYYTLFFFCSFIEFGAILVNGLVLSNQTEQEQNGDDAEMGMLQNPEPHHEEQGPEMNPDPNHSSTGGECNICFLEYSAPTVIPRILVGCGHTVCQGCLLKFPIRPKDTIFCPFCRSATLLPGGLASNLPRNFGMLAMIQGRGN